MSKVYRAKDVNEAIELAYEFKDSFKYDWFRGQRISTWKPHSSLFRINSTNNSIWENESKEKMARFTNWVNETKGLEDIAGNIDSVRAIAQYYGIPTYFLDFSLDPAVAGYFSADSMHENNNSECCIYCLNIHELCKTLPEFAEAYNIPEICEIEPISIDIPKLWRLNAQFGVFLYVPMNWDDIYQMDRIVFPYTGYPAFPSKKDIYPERKSPLELVLDQFFDNERKIEGIKRLFDMISVTGREGLIPQEVEPYPDYIDKTKFKENIAKHHSWSNIDKWLIISNDRYDDVSRTVLEFQIDWQQPPGVIENSFLKGLMFSLRRNENIRNQEITIKLNVPDNGIDFKTLQKGLDLIWDGMRLLPYSNEQLTKSLSRWLRLILVRFHEKKNDSEINLCLRSIHDDDCIEIEFGGDDGSSSRAWVPKKDIYGSIRSDLNDIVSLDYYDMTKDIIQILLACYNPKILFDFDKLVEIFAHHIIPTQLTRRNPVIFNPTRIATLGLP